MQRFNYNRRQVLKRGAVLTAGLMSAPHVLRPFEARAAGQVVFASFGGSVLEALDSVFFKPFTKETGIQVITTGAVDLAKLKAQVQAQRVEWDILSLQPSEVLTARDEKLVDPIDYSIVKVTESDFIFPEAKGTHWVSTQNYTGGIGYNSTKFPSGKGPNNWKDFWDVSRFPGRRGLRARPNDTLEIALMADGVPAEKVYPIDLKRSFASLDKIKSHINKWIDTAPQSIQLVQTGEVDLSYTFHNRVAAAQANGLPIEFSNQQLLVFLNAYSVPKGCRNPKGAMQLLNFMMQPKLQAELWDKVRLIPLASAAMQYISAQDKDKWIPQPNAGNLPIDANWWGEPGRLAEVTTQFRDWLLI